MLNKSLLIGLLLLTSFAYSETCMNVTVTSDTLIYEASPTTNYDGNNYSYVGFLGVYPGTDSRTLMKFDLSSIPGTATITSATLHFHVDATLGGGQNAGIYRITPNAWTANQVTWNVRATATNWNTAGLGSGTDYSATPLASGVNIKTVQGYNVGLDVSEMQLMLANNYGLVILPEILGGSTYSKVVVKEQASNIPILVVCYDVNTATPTPSATPTISYTQTNTPTIPTVTWTATETATRTPTITKTLTPSMTSTRTRTPSITMTSTGSPTATETLTLTPSETLTPSITATITKTNTRTPTVNLTIICPTNQRKKPWCYGG